MEPEARDTGTQTTRGRFLRRLATFAAAGLGVALVPARALAQSGQCCYNTSQCGGCGGSTPYPYRCTGCGSGPCCICSSRNPSGGNCFTTPCPCP